MNKITMLRLGLATAAATTALVFASPAAAQATRTWVSGVGDDVNPCSRTAPCKTFAGAISKTAAGGEINCLDPGGFGAVTITKAMTISCPYTEGGALAGGNGIVVNAGVNDVVFLRGLDIFGVNPPTNGVRFIAGGALHIEDSTIRRFNAVNSFGVSFQPSGTARLFISNTTIANNGNGATGGGILVQPTGAAGGARVHLSNVRLQGNANFGLRIDTTNNPSVADVFVTVENSQVAQSGTGISLFTPAAGGSDATMAVNNTVIVDNTTGIRAEGNFSRGTVANSTITQNTTGVTILGGAAVNSYGNNRLNANGANGAFTAPNVNPL
jgi:hypothetical protein